MPPKQRSGVIKRMPLDMVIPYWRNPRRVTGEAVEAIGQSVTEYGYHQPIVVDERNCIIIGHTRYAALRRLGVDEADVMVVDYLTEQQVKQLRVIDNRSSEYTSWDLDMLLNELENAESALMKALFSDVLQGGDGSRQESGSVMVDNRDFTHEWEDVDTTVEFVCPTCFHTFETEVTHDDIIKGKIEAHGPA